MHLTIILTTTTATRTLELHQPPRHFFHSTPGHGDPRWRIRQPVRPLWFIISALTALILVHTVSYWIFPDHETSFRFLNSKRFGGSVDPYIGTTHITVAFGFIFLSIVDLTLFCRHRLNPVYVIATAALCCVWWGMLVVGGAALVVADVDWMEVSYGELAGGRWRAWRVLTVLDELARMWVFGVYLWYFGIAMRAWRREIWRGRGEGVASSCRV